MRTLEETWASFRVCLTAFKRVVQCTLGNQFLWIKKNDHIIFIKCSQKWKKKLFYALYHSFMFSLVKKGKLVRPNISPTWNRKFCPFFESIYHLAYCVMLKLPNYYNQMIFLNSDYMIRILHHNIAAPSLTFPVRAEPGHIWSECNLVNFSFPKLLKIVLSSPEWALSYGMCWNQKCTRFLY